MIILVAAFALIFLWERPNLIGWPAGERVAFWVLWTGVLGWCVAVLRHANLSTLPGISQWLFEPWARRLLTPQKDVFW